jgi:UTP--glucose-1-phosphate uridylyltransferase
MRIKTAIVVAAGWGTRRLPITKAIEKSMLPIGNRPIIDYIVHRAVLAGVERVIVVVDDRTNSQIESYYADNPVLDKFLTARGKTTAKEQAKTYPDGVELIFHKQRDMNTVYGTAAPVAQVIEHYKLSEHTLVLYGDSFFESEQELVGLTSTIKNPDESAVLLFEVPEENTPLYGIAKVKNDFVVDFVEKPALGLAPSNFASSGYIFAPILLKRVVKYMQENNFGPNEQEYLLTDPVLHSVRAGEPMRFAIAKSDYLDGGSTTGWLAANNLLMGKANA